MLNNALILVAEDEPFIALEVALAIKDAGGMVLGPVASVRKALELIEANIVVAAILDVNLTDGDISPVAELLLNLDIPMVLQSGVGLPTALAAKFSKLTVQTKPCVPAELVAQIDQLICDHEQAVWDRSKPALVKKAHDDCLP